MSIRFIFNKYIMMVIINELLDNYERDENIVQLHFFNYVPASENLNYTIPFAKAQKLLVNFTVENNGNCDSCIENLITCAVDIDKNL